MRHVLLALSLLACKGESQPTATGETDGPTDTDDTDVPATPVIPTANCGVLLGGSVPVSGATDVSVSAPIQILFNSMATPADAWSINVTGVTGTSSLDPDGLRATFVPDEPLEYETTYAIEANVCQDGGLYTFTTENRPLLDQDVEGKTYAVAFPNIAFSAPPPALMAQIAGNVADWILVQVVDIDDVTNEFTANAGSADTVAGTPIENCAYAFDAGTGDFSNRPELNVGPSMFTIPIGANNVNIENFTLSGTFGAQGDTIQDIQIGGKLDTRGIPIPGGLDACFLAGLAGVTCIQCVDGALRCLNVAATAPLAEHFPTLDIEATCNP